MSSDQQIREASADQKRHEAYARFNELLRAQGAGRDFDLMPNGFAHPIKMRFGTTCGDADPGIGIQTYNYGKLLNNFDGYCGGAMTIAAAKRLRDWLTVVIECAEQVEIPSFYDIMDQVVGPSELQETNP